MICEHKNKKELNENYQICQDCGVWIGNRESFHNYTGDYYHNNNIINHGIPTREWYWNKHFKIWERLGIDIDKFRKIIEIGCGIGRLLWTFHRYYGKECVGIEYAPWACDWQKQVYGATDRYKIINANVEEIEIPSGFDFIYSCHLLEHIINPMRLLESLYKKLNDKGWMYIVIPDKEHQESLHTHNWSWDKKGIELWFRQLGLKNINTVETDPYNPPPIPPKEKHAGQYLHIGGQKIAAN